MSIRNEEYAPVAEGLIKSFKRDLNDFENVNTTFNNDYLSNFNNKINEVRQKESTDVLLVKQKDITQKLYNLSNDFRKTLNVLSFIFDKANVQSKLPSEILKLINKRNFEGTIDKLHNLKEVVDDNNDNLTTNGLTQATTTAISTMYEVLAKLTSEQTEVQKKRKLFTNNNKKLYKELYVYIADISKMGKIIFKNEKVADEYTIDKLVASMHHNITKPQKPKED